MPTPLVYSTLSFSPTRTLTSSQPSPPHPVHHKHPCDNTYHSPSATSTSSLLALQPRLYSLLHMTKPHFRIQRYMCSIPCHQVVVCTKSGREFGVHTRIPGLKWVFLLSGRGLEGMEAGEGGRKTSMKQ